MVIAPNHVSLIDGPLIHSFLPFDSVFAVDTGIAKAWWAKPFMKMIRVYTLDPTNPFATRHLVGIVKSGDPLVIFPEGRVTVTGSLMKVYDGAAMIADKGDAVIVPARIEGAQRSTLSYLKSWQVKKALFPKVTLTFLPPVKLKIDEALRGRARRLAAGAALQDVMTNAFVENAALDRTLFQGLVAAYRNFDHGKPAVEDPLTGGLTYKRLILGAQILARKIMAFTEVGENVGVLLPNANGVAVTLFALQTAGRVPAMLNFSAGLGAVASACATAKVKTILTSRAFIDKGRLGPLADGLAKTCKLVYLEDVRAGIGFADKLRGLLDGMKPLVPRSPNDPAAVLFTSGSEGAPKGVVLSHRNILANAAQALARIDANSADKVFNALPVFHSFGLTGGLMMPLLAGVPVYLYPSPLHYRHHSRAGLSDQRDHPVRHRHVPRGLCAHRAPLRLPLAAARHRRRRSGQGAHARSLRSALRPAHSRRLRRHRDLAGAGDEHADGQQARHRRAAVAADGGASRSGARHRRRRAPRRARAERDARLSTARKIPACSNRRPAAGTTPATSSPSTRRASSPSRAAPSASPRSPARWCRLPPAKPWRRPSGRKRNRSSSPCPTRAKASGWC